MFDLNARVWDAHSGELLFTIDGHDREVSESDTWRLLGNAGRGIHAAFSPDGRGILSTSVLDASARLHDAETGELLFSLEGHEEGILDANFSPDGQLIVTASHDKTVRLWDAVNGKLRRTLDGCQSSVRVAFFNTSGRRIIGASSDDTIRLWDVDSGVEVACLPAAEATYTCVAPDEKHIVATNVRGEILVWPSFPDYESLMDHADELIPDELPPEEQLTWPLPAADNERWSFYGGSTRREVRSPDGESIAILHETVGSTWLYVHGTPMEPAPGSVAVFVYSSVAPVGLDQAFAMMEHGHTPMLPGEHANQYSVRQGIESADISVRWSNSGGAVTVLLKGEPLSLFVVGDSSGYSKGISKEGFLGQPWSQRLFDSHFG
ncbi:MAG: WD40 repeat domain-containing protein [Acidimicrobiales bacterium]